MTALLDPATCRLSELTEHIRNTHHAYLKCELPAIWELFRESVAQPSRAGATRPVARLFGRFRATLENHLRKEEEVLFPFVERLEEECVATGTATEHPFGPLRLPMEILEAEHALGDRMLDQMRPMWQAWSADADAPLQLALARRLDALDADMHRHVHIEDAVLFPRTVRLEGR